MELEVDKEYLLNGEWWWVFKGWISDDDNPGKRKASFVRMEKHHRFVSEDDIESSLLN